MATARTKLSTATTYDQICRHRRYIRNQIAFQIFKRVNAPPTSSADLSRSPCEKRETPPSSNSAATHISDAPSCRRCPGRSSRGHPHLNKLHPCRSSTSRPHRPRTQRRQPPPSFAPFSSCKGNIEVTFRITRDDHRTSDRLRVIDNKLSTRYLHKSPANHLRICIRSSYGIYMKTRKDDIYGTDLEVCISKHTKCLTKLLSDTN